MTIAALLQVLSVLMVGLVAGLFYGYDSSVIGGLGKLGSREYLMAFKEINRAILNPYFFVSFMGALVVLPLAVWMGKGKVPDVSFYLMIGAAVVYFVGVFGVTVIGNIPLNESLDRLDLRSASAESIESFRFKFEAVWSRYHHVRTWLSILAFVLAIVSLMFSGPAPFRKS
ncbi:MAG: anthrone oxygenase family protein [Flavitalea sp.]